MTLSIAEVERFVEHLVDEIEREPDPVARRYLFGSLARITDTVAKRGLPRCVTQLMREQRSVRRTAQMLKMSESAVHRILDADALTNGVRLRRYPSMGDVPSGGGGAREVTPPPRPR